MGAEARIPNAVFPAAGLETHWLISRHLADQKGSGDRFALKLLMAPCPVDTNSHPPISPLQFNPSPALLALAPNPKSAALRSKNTCPPPGQLRGSSYFPRVRIAGTLELISIKGPTASIEILVCSNFNA